MKITNIVNLVGIVVGVYMFGWWFLVPGFLCVLTVSQYGEEI